MALPVIEFQDQGFKIRKIFVSNIFGAKIEISGTK